MTALQPTFGPGIWRPAYDVAGVLARLRITVRQSGDQAYACCPLPGHTDRRPSWSVHMTEGVWYCHGCATGGNLEQLVMAMGSLSQPDAGAWLSPNRTGTSLAPLHSPSGIPEPVLVALEAEQWFCSLPAPRPRQLSRRRISPEAARLYDLRRDGADWIIPVYAIAPSPQQPGAPALLGWQRKYGKYVSNEPAGMHKAQSVFGYHEALNAWGNGHPAIITESPLDVARIASAGIPGAVATYGSRMSDIQAEAILARCADPVLALDKDAPGMEATAAIQRRFPGRFRVWEFFDSSAKDPGEMENKELVIRLSALTGESLVSA